MIEKAFYMYGIPVEEEAKNCSLISVAEIYKLDLKVGKYLEEDIDKEMYYSFWEDVKEEIEKL